jgi:hypothetical protein
MKKIFLALLLGGTLSFGGFNLADYLGGFSNSTSPATSWDLKEGTLISGGGYEYRYAFSGNMKPLFAAKAPSVKIGCGSISLDGGFLAYLGLDDIETQFTDASAAFAFGFMSALELTMPEVAAVIHKLQQWARMLQQLLANACQAGKNAGGNFFKSLWNKASSEGTSTFIGITGNPKTKESEFTKFINDLPGSDQDFSSFTEEKKKDVVTKIQTSAGGSSMLLSLFGNYLPTRQSETAAPLVVLDGKLSEFLRDKKLGDKSLNMKYSAGAFGEKKDLYLLLRVLFGDVYATDSAVSYIERYFNSNGTINTNALKQDISLSVYGGAGGDLKIGPGFFKGSPYSPEEIASALIYGFNRLGGSGTNSVSIPDNKLVYIDAKLDTGAPGAVMTSDGNMSTTVSNTPTGGADENRTVHTVKTLLIQDSSTGSFDVDFAGFKEGSKLAIEAKVKDDISFDWNTITVPNAVPGMGRYIKTLRLLYKKNNSNLVVDSLINNLAELNAYYVSYAFLSKTESMIRYHKNNAKVALDKTSVKLLRDNLDKLADRVRKIKKALEKKIPKISSMPSVSKDFEMLDKQIKEDVSKVVGE